MDSSTRWTAIAVVMGLCVAYGIWGGRPPVAPPPQPVSETQPARVDVVPPAPVEPEKAAEPPPAHAQPQPKSALKITPGSIEFGEVKVTEKKSAAVLVENTGKEPVTIEDLKGSCGCLKVEMPEKTIAPGASQPLNITFTGMAGRRPEKYMVTLTTSEAGRPRLPLPVHGKVNQIFIVEPMTLYFESVPKGQSKTLEATVTRLDGKPFVLKNVNAEPKKFSFKWSAVPGTNDSVYKIQATAFGLQAGAFTEGAAVVTDHPDLPVIPLHLSVRVLGDVSSASQVLTSSVKTDGTVEPFETIIKRHTPGPLQIQGVADSEKRPLSFNIVRIDDGSCRLSITLSGTFPNQPPLGEFVIRTNVEDAPMHLPYRVVRKGAVLITDPNLKTKTP
ncbi:MAG TPA: DUF1573 domain-containing protein [Planctomycetota bacterium]|nr:DUF1573 domain-containing protein [Planctomycetota bacterium]